MGIEVKITDNSGDILSALPDAIERALKIGGVL